MSNNRMYLKCQCGKSMMLAKLWGGHADAWKDKDQIADFLNEHFFCENSVGRCNGTSIKIEYEDPCLEPLDPKENNASILPA